MSVSIVLATALLLGADVDGEGQRPPAPDLSLRDPSPPRQVYRLNLAVDIPVTVAGGLAALARAFLKDKLARISCPCNPAGLNFIDRGAVSSNNSGANVASDVAVAIAIAGPPVIDLFDVGLSKAFGEDLMIFAETLAVDTAIQQVANFAVARPRPRTYANDPAYLTSAEGYLSFYSGHVATVFAALSAASSTVRLRYGEQIWPWILTGAVGSSVAVERVLAGSHFPTDVLAGALAGVAIGIAVPWLHARPREERLSILPAEGGRGLAFAGAF
ncbi:MAG: phosphatase PAP2 family protein [Deltaproteobacteria bacterium]|nr:MAG: phosphatase PAP2 family protein [Deltaproteobacteria bacterium]